MFGIWRASRLPIVSSHAVEHAVVHLAPGSSMRLRTAPVADHAMGHVFGAETVRDPMVGRGGGV